MDRKKITTLLTLLPLAAVGVYFLNKVGEMPLNSAIAGIFGYIIYGLLIVIYLVRVTLVALGIYATYKVLRGWYRWHVHQSGLVL